MPIAVDCPGCGKEMTLPDNVRGKKIRCTACETVFLIPGPAGATTPAKSGPASRTSTSKTGVRGALDNVGAPGPRKAKPAREDRDEYGEPTRKGDGSQAQMMIIGGGLALLLLVGGLGFLLMGRGKKPDGAEPVAANNAVPPEQPGRRNRPAPDFAPPPPLGGVPDAPAAPAMPRDFAPPPPVAGAPAVPGVPPDPQAGDAPPGRARPNRAGGGNPAAPKPPRPGGNNFNEAVELANWDVKPDPSPVKLDLPAKLPKLAAAIPNNGEVVYPSGPSYFFATCEFFFNKSLLVWDIRTGKMAGRIDAGRDLDLKEPFALSPDGTLFAGIGGFGGKTVDVFNTKTKKGVRRLTFEGNWGGATYVEFREGGKELVVVRRDGGDSSVETYSIETGDQLKSVTTKDHFDANACALSPGGRYLAYLARGRLNVVDLKEGESAGSARVGHEQAGFHHSGLAWSADGKEIAVYLPGHNTATVTVLDVAKGEELASHDLSENQFSIFSGGYQGPGLEYLPRGDAWLLDGQYVVDRASGSLVEKLAFPQGDHKPGRRRLLDTGTILTVAGDNRGKGVVAVQLDMKKLGQKADLAKNAKKGLDPAKPGDPAAGKQVAAGKPAWGVTPDAGRPARVNGAVPLRSKTAEVSGVAFARPDRPVAATVGIGEVTEPFPHRALRVERYDLATRKPLAGVEVPASTKDIKAGYVPDFALSDEGAITALVYPNDLTRVDLFDPAGKHLLGLQPYPDNAEIDWVGLIGENRLLTLGSQGKLAAWDVPSGKAVYACGGDYQGTVALSPNRKWAVAYTGTGFDVLDTATGEVKGRCELAGAAPAPAKDRRVRISVRGDGEAFAAVLPAQGNQRVVAFETRGGKPIAEFDTGTVGTESLTWGGADLLVQGGKDVAVIDLTRRGVVWNYRNPWASATADATIDARHWYVTGARPGAQEAALFAVDLPEPQTAAELKASKAAGVQTLFSKDTPVAVRVTGAGPKGGDPAAYPATVVAQAEARLRAEGFRVEPGAKVVIAANGTEGPSGETATLIESDGMFGPRFGPFGPFGPGGRRPGGLPRPLDPGQREVGQLSLPQVTGSLTLTDAAGAVLWKADQTLKYGEGMNRDLGKGDPATVLSQDVWNFFANWVTNPRMPAYILRLGGRTINLPGETVIQPK